MRKRMNVMGAVCAFALAGAILPAPSYAATQVALPEEGIAWEEGKTVYYKDDSSKADGKDYTGQYATMVEALKAVYQSDPEDPAELYCKPNADVGVMTHGHVADSLTIYGNDAYVSGGEHDFEIDTYSYNRKTGAQDEVDGVCLDEDVTLTVKGLDGAAAWGQRNTGHKITLVFEDCQNMNRVYFTGTTGPIDLSIEGCSFNAGEGSNADTSVYSNAVGTISVSNTAFTGIAVPINLNNKTTGSTRLVAVSDCVFTDCSNVATVGGAQAYAAPIRVVGVVGTTTNVELSNLEFNYSDGVEQCGNGDVLLGEGRNGLSQLVVTGVVNLKMTGTDANVVVQKPGYCDGSGNVLKPENAHATDATSADLVTGSNKDESPIVATCTHANRVAHPAVEATCTKEGVEAYWECPDCEKLFSDEACTVEISSPVAIAKKDHVAGAWQSDSKEHWSICRNEGCGTLLGRAAHEFGEWTVVKGPTTDAVGSKERACATCGYKEIVELPKLEQPAKPEQPTTDDKKPASGDGSSDLPQTGDAAFLMTAVASVSGVMTVAMGAIARKRR